AGTYAECTGVFERDGVCRRSFRLLENPRRREGEGGGVRAAMRNGRGVEFERPRVVESTVAVDAARPEPSANWNTPEVAEASADANPAAFATAFAPISMVPVLVRETCSVTASNASW